MTCSRVTPLEPTHEWLLQMFIQTGPAAIRVTNHPIVLPLNQEAYWKALPIRLEKIIVLIVHTHNPHSQPLPLLTLRLKKLSRNLSSRERF